MSGGLKCHVQRIEINACTVGIKINACTVGSFSKSMGGPQSAELSAQRAQTQLLTRSCAYWSKPKICTYRGRLQQIHGGAIVSCSGSSRCRTGGEGEGGVCTAGCGRGGTSARLDAHPQHCADVGVRHAVPGCVSTVVCAAYMCMEKLKAHYQHRTDFGVSHTVPGCKSTDVCLCMFIRRTACAA
eukprot:1161423-Pelagomonas_calceolata.AAC.9